MPFNQELKNSDFLFRKPRLGAFSRWSKFTEQLNNTPSNLRRDGRASVHDFANTFQQAARRSSLQQVTAGAGAQGTKDPVVVFEYSQNQNQQIGPLLQ